MKSPGDSRNTRKQSPFFGYISDDEMILNEIGEIVREEWVQSIPIPKNIKFNQWMIMPSHIHVIVGAHGSAPLRKFHLQSKSVGSFIANFKSAATKMKIMNREIQQILMRKTDSLCRFSHLES